MAETLGGCTAAYATSTSGGTIVQTKVIGCGSVGETGSTLQQEHLRQSD